MRALGPRAQAGDPQAIAALHQTLKELRSFIAQSTQLQSDNTALADARYSLVLAAVDLAAQPAGRRPPDLVPFELLEEARLAAVAFGDAEVAANVAWRTALALRDAHELSRSRAVLESALEELDAPGMAPWLLVTQATLARQRGDWQRALDILSVAEAGLLDESHSFTSHRYTRCALVGLRGQIHIDLGLVGRAALDLAQEKELALELGDLDGWIASLIRRANLHLAREDYEGLARSVEESLASEDLFGGHPGERAQLLVRLGIARSEQERADPSRPRLASGIFHQALADKSLRPGERLTAELFLGDVLLRERALDEAATVLDSARKRLLAWNANDQLRAPAPEAASLATLSARLAVLRVAGKEELARQLTELRHAHGIFLEHWNSTPLRPAGIGFLHYGGRRAVLSELISLTLLVEGLDPGVDHILEHLMEAQALGSVSRRLGIPTGSVDAVREKLIPPGGGLLIYLSGPDRSHLIALDAAGSLYRELLPARELERLRADFVTTVTLPPSVPSTDRLYTTRAARLTTTGRALSRALLPEDIMRRVAGWGPLTVVGIDTLGYLPFEALPIMDDVALLGDRHPIAYTPTLPLGLYLADKATAQARAESKAPSGQAKGSAPNAPSLTVLVASDPGIEARERWPHLVPLPFGAAERTQLKANWKSGGVSFVEGPRVWEFFPHSNADTDAALQSEELHSAPESANLRVLEILAHGVYDPQRERPAGLALGPRYPTSAPTEDTGTGAQSPRPNSTGEQTATELTSVSGDRAEDQMFLWCEGVESSPSAELVILAACGTGRGPLRRGDDGAANLGGAFLSAGARDVILSPARLEYRSTLRLLELLHDRLTRAGESPATALYTARRLAVAQGLDPDPFHRSLLHVTGLGHRPLVSGGQRGQLLDGGLHPWEGKNGGIPVPDKPMARLVVAAGVLLMVAFVICGLRSRRRG